MYPCIVSLATPLVCLIDKTLYYIFFSKSTQYISGIVLVALNPYQDVPLYSSEVIQAYSGRQMHEIDPHIFGVAEDAFRSMVT